MSTNLAIRSKNNPLLTFKSDSCLGDNINGPSVIRVPEWIESPLGKYYMYFAHHHGDHIRMAYADHIHGPWTVYKPGTLRLSDVSIFRSHIASPDVHIDQETQEIKMYFHGPTEEMHEQWTALAISKNGLDFLPTEEIMGWSYFRVFEYNNTYYAIAMDGSSRCGVLYSSPDGKTPFVSGKQILKYVRHTAVTIRDDRLCIFYSRKGDSPERILLSTIDLTKDWLEWEPSSPIDILWPEHDYEGIEHDNVPSEYGFAINVQQLRDPCIFEEDGKTYLFYSYAGEMGIAMAELNSSIFLFKENTS